MKSTDKPVVWTKKITPEQRSEGSDFIVGWKPLTCKQQCQSSVVYFKQTKTKWTERAGHASVVQVYATLYTWLVSLQTEWVPYGREGTSVWPTIQTERNKIHLFSIWHNINITLNKNVKILHYKGIENVEVCWKV